MPSAPYTCVMALMSWGEKSHEIRPGLISISFNCFRARTASTKVSSLTA
ncbi:MAG: hypothetical protein ACFFAN_08805 [Promethearchaeota archaeon]